MQVDSLLPDERFFTGLARAVEAVLIDGEVGLGDGEFALQQALVDGAELADAQAAEIDRPPAVRSVNDEEALEDPSHDLVGERDLVDERPHAGHVGVGRKQAAVVFGHAPLAVSLLDGAEEPLHFFPLGVAVVKGRFGTDDFEEFVCLRFERAAAVEAVPAIGQEVFVLRVGDEEEPEEDGHRHFVGFGQVGGGRLAG